MSVLGGKRTFGGSLIAPIDPARQQKDSLDSGSRSMINRSDIVPVTGGVVFLPAYKLSVRLGRFDLEMNGVQMVDVIHQPDLNPAHLMMPENESPYSIYVMEGGDPRHPSKMIPFISRAQETLTSFGFPPRSEGACLVYTNPHYDASDARSQAVGLFKRLKLENAQSGFTILHHVIHALGKLENWLVKDIGFAGEWERLEVRLPRDYVVEIGSVTGLSFPSAGSDSCLISGFELAR